MQHLVETPAPRLLSPGATAARTAISFRTIQRYVSTGDFPAPVKIGAMRIAFVEAEVNAWIAALPRVKEAA